jgi:tetrapyrrole methylase family protein/MazG family protein
MSRATEAIDRFLSIMSRLRSSDGCPWDREQTLASLRPCLLEETYEVLEAIEDGSPSNHCEELGDLLLQIVFQAQIRMEEGAFDFADLTQGISDKLVSRHPHVFGDAKVKDAEGVMRQWAALKQKEKQRKGGGQSALDGVPRELPALARADRLTEKAGRVGFDWPNPSGARRKVEEELRELDEAIAAGDQSSIEHELGDLLFAVANLARKLAVSPEEALRGTLGRFVERFEFIERELAAQGVAMADASLEDMDRLWNRAKQLFSQRAKSP